MARTILVPLVLPADPVAAMEATTKQYVDNHPGEVWISTTEPDPVLYPGIELWYDTDDPISPGMGQPGPPGPQGPPGPSTVSADPGNLAVLGSDSFIYVPPAASGLQKVIRLAGGGIAVSVAHNLNTRNVFVEVYRSTAPYDTVGHGTQRPDLNSVTLIFNTAPTAGEYTAVILG